MSSTNQKTVIKVVSGEDRPTAYGSNKAVFRVVMPTGARVAITRAAPKVVVAHKTFNDTIHGSRIATHTLTVQSRIKMEGEFTEVVNGTTVKSYLVTFDVLPEASLIRLSHKNFGMIEGNIKLGTFKTIVGGTPPFKDGIPTDFSFEVLAKGQTDCDSTPCGIIW